MRRNVLTVYFLGLLVATSLVVAQSPPKITYVYDKLGRLVGVVDPNGDAATYSYDGVGNIPSITGALSGHKCGCD